MVFGMTREQRLRSTLARESSSAYNGSEVQASAGGHQTLIFSRVPYNHRASSQR